MALVAMPMVPFTWPISVHTFASIITGIPGVEVPEASTVDSLTGRIAFDNDSSSIEPRVKN